MRALILYGSQGGLSPLAKGVAAGLEAAGYRAELVEAASRSSAPLQVFGYDLICVGSAVRGRFGGQVAEEIGDALQRCTRLEGKSAAAFVRRRWLGSTRALRQLMELMEGQGAQVRDFAALADPKAAERFGRRLHWEE